MRQKMKVEGWLEVLTCFRTKYALSNRAEKGVLIDELVELTGYHEKYVVTLLNGTAFGGGRPAKRGGRVRMYDEEVEKALITIWRALNRICSKRMVPFIGEMISSLERFNRLTISPVVRSKLLCISPATADRLLAAERSREARGLCTTAPGKLLKKQVVVRTFNDWGDLRPGYLEVDCVAHCGGCSSGQYIYTLVLTDVCTGWLVLYPMLNRTASSVLAGLE